MADERVAEAVPTVGGPENPCPLEGLRVCILRTSDYAVDARVRKQATALTEAGAHVTIVGIGASVPPDLAESAWDVRVLPPPVRSPRLGREDVWWPVRVAVNLTYTRTLEKWFAYKTASLVSRSEPALAAAALESRPDIVHSYDIFTLPAAVRVKQATGARVIYDCRDLYTDVEYLDEPTRQKLSAFESELISQADEVTVVSEVFADILESRYGIRRPSVVYNGPSEIMPSATSVHQPVRVLFQGALKRNRNLGSLIEAMSDLRGRATLTLQGFGGIGDELRQLVTVLDLDDVVTFAEPCAPLEVVRSASEHDVGVICYKADSLNLESTVPNKLMDYLGGGLALAVSDLPGPRSVLDETGAAIFIDPSSAETLAEGIGRLLEDPGRITKMKVAALKAAEMYEWPVQARVLVGVYARALEAQGVPKD